MTRTIRGMWRLGAVAALVALACTEWPTRFERVDANRMRHLQSAIINLSDTSAGIAEAAPGDSVMLAMYLAGEPVVSAEWDVSWNVFIGPLSQDTAYDRQPLAYETVTIDSAGFSDSTDIVAIKFRIPEDVIAVSANIDDGLIAALGSAVDTNLGRAELLERLDAFARTPHAQRELVDPQLHGALLLYGSLPLQILTAPVRIFVTVNGVNRMYGDLSVRYNRLLREYPDIGVNRNPILNYAGICKVRKPVVGMTVANMGDDDTLISFVPPSPAFALDPLSSSTNIVYTDTLFIETGFSYYVVADSGVFAGVDTRDSARPLILGPDGLPTLGTKTAETYYTRWYYQFDPDQIDGVAPSEQLIINSSGGLITTPMYPPLDTGITQVTFWAQVYDYLGESYRPVGTTLIERRINLRYSTAYADSVNAIR